MSQAIYNIEYSNNEDIFDFETAAMHPFEAYKKWQENIACLGDCRILSVVKNKYKLKLF